MSEFKDWFYSIPFFTRWWLAFTVVLSLVGRLNQTWIYRYFVLNFYTLLNDFQIWQPITALFFYPPGFHFLINCYFLYTYSMRLETGIFAGKPADYFFLLIFNWVVCVAVGLLLSLPLLMDPMILSVLYVWAQLNKDVIVTFWFGTRFRAMYLPWALFAFNVMQGGGMLDLIGIMIGHLSFFVFFKYPQEFGGPYLVQTPAFLKRIFPDSRVMGGFGPTQPARAPTRPNTTAFGGHQWGRGYTLGGN